MPTLVDVYGMKKLNTSFFMLYGTPIATMDPYYIAENIDNVCKAMDNLLTLSPEFQLRWSNAFLMFKDSMDQALRALPAYVAKSIYELSVRDIRLLAVHVRENDSFNRAGENRVRVCHNEAVKHAYEEVLAFEAKQSTLVALMDSRPQVVLDGPTATRALALEGTAELQAEPVELVPAEEAVPIPAPKIPSSAVHWPYERCKIVVKALQTDTDSPESRSHVSFLNWIAKWFGLSVEELKQTSLQTLCKQQPLRFSEEAKQALLSSYQRGVIGHEIRVAFGYTTDYYYYNYY